MSNQKVISSLLRASTSLHSVRQCSLLTSRNISNTRRHHSTFDIQSFKPQHKPSSRTKSILTNDNSNNNNNYYYVQHISTSSISTKTKNEHEQQQQQQQQPESTSKQKKKQTRTQLSFREEIEEYKKLTDEGNSCQYDKKLIKVEQSLKFPRIKTTSMSTKRIVISDECKSHAATLIVVAFRNFADTQLLPWKTYLSSNFPHLHWYDVTVNESFASQAFSGFVQSWQRSSTDPKLHDFHVAFNNKARQPLEDLLISSNRMFGNVLLLDRNGHVRFRAAGHPNGAALSTLHSCIEQLIKEESN